ncbi:hypothetical protein GLA29479_3632 [Lysobacter antibioticus]|uniref:hypothetical protein n=1 Tax=Lysobacter antibioticus TaxID=84531 RepID=UPI00071719BC|nr:hypothetical protein [Lysobacter antibioticus]ALN64485.1 hypothetical protein GLA29479_3632 [Lysobacter antibioticus]
MDVVLSFLGYALCAVIVFAQVFLLWGILRYAVISPWITRGASAALKRPDIEGSARVVGFPLPIEAGDFYRSAPFLQRLEFVLVAPSGRRWRIGRFYPLVPRHVRENRKVHGTKNVPIASDQGKGVYVLLADGAVAHQPLGSSSQVRMVCRSLGELARFNVASDD